MTFLRGIQLLSNDLRHAYLRPLMICKCITCVTSERFQKANERCRSGIYNIAMTSIVLTRGSFYSPRKALEIFSGADSVTDCRFNIFIGLSMAFGFEKKIRKLFIP